ncbi:restriction endonuclease subunit S [Photobacterium leiognathi]|uniref:restriction endonuclease subunit S n=1 Tax=Photobacterium leiognathi TaxID=553611 RepID=UPI00298195CD|nr:restriction endonuclease subunit S [Photobacterium leiognathi]
MTEQMNVPKLRFGEFDGEYIDTTLEDLTKKKISYGIVQAGPHIPNGMPYIKSTNLNKELCLDDLERTSDEIAKSYQRSEVVPEDIVFSLRGNIGATRIVPETIPVANLTQGTARLSIRNNFSNVYVNYCLGTRKAYKRVNSVSKGSTFQEISLADLRKVKITHSVDIKEQQKIASFLSKVDEKISLLTEKKDKLAEYKKGVMQQLFNGSFQEQDGQLTFIPPTLRFKADDGSEFPDWEEKKLGSLADLTSSKRVYLSDYSEDGVPFFRGKEISEIRKGIIPDDVLYITRKAFEEFKSKYGAPVEGDILVTAVGTLANILRVTGEFEFYFKDGNLIWLRKPRCDSKFLSILMEANRHELLKTAIGSSQKALTIVELKKIVFKMPSLEEQQKITIFLSSLEEKVRLANSELEKANEWKKGLLQQMFV